MGKVKKYIFKRKGGSFLFGTYKDATTVFSIRKCMSSYKGASMRVQRDSDLAELDIGFDGSGNLDTASLMSFAGNDTVVVSAWYNQAGATITAPDATRVSGATIVNNGVLNTLNGKPNIVEPDFSMDGFKINGNTRHSVHTVNNPALSSNQLGMFHSLTSSGYYIFRCTSTLKTRLNSGSVSSSYIQAFNQQRIYNYAYNNVGASINQFADGVDLGTVGIYSASSWGALTTRLGAGVRWHLQEVIVQISTDAVNDRLDIEQNQNTYYNTF